MPSALPGVLRSRKPSDQAQRIRITPRRRCRSDRLRDGASITAPIVRHSPLNGEQPPGARHALEIMLSAILELDVRASHKVCNRAGHEGLPRLGCAADPLGRMNRDTCDVIIALLNLSDVDSAANVDPNLAERIGNGLRTAYGRCRSVEGGEHPVAGCLHQPTAEAR